MSSETSAQWPVVAPGFMYIVKMGDYTHILQPADQKSSEHLNLAQVAIRDVNIARKLLEERGPFLLQDKQEKMDELISETETAINRVIRILEPARIQPISEQSIRFNTRDPWALEDSPKSAATFGRLQITHNALKTVVHNLSNIEATVALDDCNDRVEVNPTIANGTPPAVAIQKTPSKGASSNLLTWKWSRRANRHAPDDSVSSVDTPKSDQNSNNIFSPIGPDERMSNMPAGDSGQAHRDSVSEPDSSLQLDSAVDQASDVSFDRLPVIHELEGGSSIVQLGPVRPQDATLDDTQDADSSLGKSKAVVGPETPRENTVVECQPFQTPRNKHNRVGSTPPALRVTPPTLKQNNRVKRETFEELRQRNREDKHSSSNTPSHSVQSPQPVQGEPSRYPQSTSNSASQAPSRFQSLKARIAPGSVNKDAKNLTDGVASEWRDNDRNILPRSKPPAPMIESSNVVPNQTNQGLIQERNSYVKEGNVTVKSATYPPIRTQLQPPTTSDNPSNSSLGPSHQVLSPSRAQLSPLEQVQSPDVTDSIEGPPLQPHQRDHQIFDIDPVLTRLPSLLKAARPRRDDEPRSHSRSRSHKPDELHFPESVLPAPAKEPLDRSVTAPPLFHPGMQGPHRLSQNVPTREELAHLRSMSDTAVPQVSSVRGPIPPRKPLPYRNSPLPSREPSPHVVSRIATPLPERPQSESIQTPPNVPQSSKATSGPPSPIHSDHHRTLAPQIPRAPSTQSLQVQASSSAGSSRKSSISDEGALKGVLSKPARPLKTNGLAMNPPEIPDRGTSAYQAQKLAEDAHAKQPEQVPVQAPDYRSPAWQQTRHYFNPGHNVQLEQAPSSNNPAPSRFRDQDNRPRSALMNAVRSKTIPEPALSSHNAVNSPEQPRRASEQASVPLLASPQPPVLVPSQQPQSASIPPKEQLEPTNVQSSPRLAPSPRPSEQNRSNFLQHQAARLHARQQSNQAPILPPAPPLPLTQVKQRPPQQALPLRVLLTPHHPQEMSRPPHPVAPHLGGKQTATQTVHDAVTTAPNAVEKQQMVKDKHLLATKIFRPNADKQPTPPREASGERVRQTSQQPQAKPSQLQAGSQGRRPPSLTQPQYPPSQQPHQNEHPTPRPTPLQTPLHPHECHCDSPIDVAIENSKPTSSESLKDLIKMNNQLAQNVPSIPTAPMRNEERTTVPVAGQTNGQAREQGQAEDQRVGMGEGVDYSKGKGAHHKKKSWLVHQASKIAGKTGN